MGMNIPVGFETQGSNLGRFLDVTSLVDSAAVFFRETLANI